MKFTNLALAYSYSDRAFETNNKSLMVLMYDCPYYLVCTPREAGKLLKQGYELAQRP